jgi:2-oxo-4-hydroxy-4-carboxy-5-ureidoimidazoline decarboxylase
MSGTPITHGLARWNSLSKADAAKDILPCCGSTAWAEGIARRRPLPDEATLLAASDETWRNLAEEDWMEAFRSHPRIGESKGSGAAAVQSLAWSKQEQQNVTAADNAFKNGLAEANKEYEARFNRTFIVCATGKSAQEILEILRRRLRNDDETELREAAEQQRLITHIRLKKWLAQ